MSKQKEPRSKEHSLKLSEIALKDGRKPPSNKGKHFSAEHRKKISESNKGKSGMNGKNHPNWKGGITPINQAIRTSTEYKLWRKSIYERDKWTCIWCGYKGKNIHADHIKPFALFPELRFAIDNGRTLCRDCHRTTDTYGYVKNYKK